MLEPPTPLMIKMSKQKKKREAELLRKTRAYYQAKRKQEQK